MSNFEFKIDEIIEVFGTITNPARKIDFLNNQCEKILGNLSNYGKEDKRKILTFLIKKMEHDDQPWIRLIYSLTGRSSLKYIEDQQLQEKQQSNQQQLIEEKELNSKNEKLCKIQPEDEEKSTTSESLFISTTNLKRSIEDSEKPTASELSSLFKTNLQPSIEDDNEQPTTSKSVILSTSNSQRQFSKLLDLKKYTNNKFNISNYIYTFKFKNLIDSQNDLLCNINIAFNEIFNIITKNIPPASRVGLKISLVENTFIKSKGIAFKEIDEFKSKHIIELMESLSDSNSTFLYTDTFDISITTIAIPCGKGRKYAKLMTEEDLLKTKNSVIDLKVDEPYCLPAAIIAGKSIADGNKKYLLKLRRNTKFLNLEVIKFVKQAKVNINDRVGSPVTDAYLYHKMLSDYNLIIYGDKNDPNTTLYHSYNKNRKTISIFYFEKLNHFVTLNTAKGFFGKRFQCKYCSLLYDNKNYHPCKEKCSSCSSIPPCNQNIEKINCPKCFRYFYGVDCLRNHCKISTTKHSICDLKKFCPTCGKMFDMQKRNFVPHVCTEKTCPICFEIVPENHQCYLQKYKTNPLTRFTIIFYDLQCTSNINVEDETIMRKPNICVVNTVCHKCFNFEIPFYCSNCKQREHVFENDPNGDDCIKKFIDFCELHRPNVTKVLCIAHNMDAYKRHFILNELIRRDKTIETTMKGIDLLQLKYNGFITFKDSINFIPFSISNFQRLFGINDINIQRNWYPHLFNTNENYNYIGEIPNKNYFDFDAMNELEQNEFLKWYEEQQKTVFENKKELIKFCCRNVEHLRLAALKFINDFSITKINPFIQSLSLTQAVVMTFKKNFMKEKQIGIIPENLYRKGKRQSKMSLMWLAYKKNTIKHNLLICEFNIPGTKYYVDAFDPKNNIVFEFLECFSHGCMKCFPNRNKYLNIISDSIDLRYQTTLARLDQISSLGYEIDKIWECEFEKLLTINTHLRSILANDILVKYSRLKPCEAVFGARTETFQNYYKVKAGEKIRHLQYNSLYPYVNKYMKYPVGHPNIFVGNAECSKLDITKLEGLIKCAILAPRKLSIPVLPIFIDNKYVFPLCRTCVQTVNVYAPCQHSEDERVLIGTWVIDEVRLALSKGYIIKHIVEIWEYKIEVYDTQTKKGGIFTDFINFCLKTQKESCEWSSQLLNQTEKDEYIKNFFAKENIELDITKIEHNPARYNLAKLCANSLWGNFVEHNDKLRTSIIEEFNELYQLLCIPGLEIQDIMFANDSKLWISWKLISDDIYDPIKQDSIPIGAFVTANARITLYHCLDKISDTVLYCDTDSIIYIDKMELPVIKTGDFMDDFSDKINCYGDDAYINEFISIEPKCFGYTIIKSKKMNTAEVLNYKGITVTANKSIINFSNFKNLINEFLESNNTMKIKLKINESLDNSNIKVINIYHSKKRQKLDKNNKSESSLEFKSFLDFKNRVYISNYKTIPFGY